MLRGDEDVAARFLAGRAGDGRALEFAIGTGRIALPLSAQGVWVDGIELSPSMIEQLRDKPGGGQLDVWTGDMTSTVTGSRYALVYLVYNTIFNVLTQDAQVDCFANAARHLDDGGVFVVEAAVPSAWLPSESYARPERVEADAVTLDVCRYDPATQILDENHVRIGSDGVRFAPISCRLAWPTELDLMARIAGLRLVERWGGWKRRALLRPQHARLGLYRALKTTARLNGNSDFNEIAVFRSSQRTVGMVPAFRFDNAP